MGLGPQGTLVPCRVLGSVSPPVSCHFRVSLTHLLTIGCLFSVYGDTGPMCLRKLHVSVLSGKAFHAHPLGRVPGQAERASSEVGGVGAAPAAAQSQMRGVRGEASMVTCNGDDWAEA